VKEYDGTTGAFIKVFATPSLASTPLDPLFGPDGNLYVGGTTAVEEFDGTTGAFIRSFPQGLGAAANQPAVLGFGPDGNLYVGTLGPCCPEVMGEILRYNPTTGALIDVFVPPGSGGLQSVGEIVFRPDGYLYVINTNTTGDSSAKQIMRYNATTGAFVDVVIPAGDGGIIEATSFTFGPATAPPAPTLISLNPNTGQQGQQNLSVNIVGQNTHFVQGTTTASFGTGITVVSLAIISATSATTVLNIDPAANLGARDVTLTTASEVAKLTNGFTVNAPVNQVPVVSAGSNQTITLPVVSAVGKIVVTNDECQLSNTGFSATETGSTQFALNVAQWFSGSSNQGSFLVYSTNFGLDPAQATTLAATMRAAGYTWISYTSIPGFAFNLATLKSYQGVFLACPEIPDNNVLTDYVNSGGNVYLEGGTGACASGGPTIEAQSWNSFLNAFGLAFDGTGYNGVEGSIPISNPLNSPILNNVSALFEDNGNNIQTTGSNAGAQIIDSFNGDGLYAVFNPSVTTPTASTTLNGSITDDGLPVGATLSATWSETSGPGPVTFSNPTSTFDDVAGQLNPVITSATFSVPGSYVLRLTGTDTLLSSSSDVTIMVLSPATLLTVNPSTGQQGQQNLSVNITGQNTNFVQGRRQRASATGITVDLSDHQ
jgi:hypothetical protein